MLTAIVKVWTVSGMALGVVTQLGVWVGQRGRRTFENVESSLEACQANKCVPGRGNNICNGTEARGIVSLKKTACFLTVARG